MKQLLLLLVLSFFSNVTLSASDAYKCNINATYRLGDDGMLFIDEDNPYGNYEKGFTFELTSNVVTSERGSRMSANSIAHWFKRLYGSLGFDGCSSHSGRRTFITQTARKISLVGGSLRDIQLMAGHSNLQTTQRYIEMDTTAQRRVVDLV